jgi:hypothetical protein
MRCGRRRDRGFASTGDVLVRVVIVLVVTMVAGASLTLGFDVDKRVAYGAGLMLGVIAAAKFRVK